MAIYSISLLRSISRRGTNRLNPKRTRKEDLISKANADAADKSDYKSLYEAEAAALQRQNKKNVKRSENDAEEKRNTKEKFQSNRGTQDFG
jgi:hypothetical protein